MPARRVLVQGEIALYLFIAGLAMFFVTGLAAYVMILNLPPQEYRPRSFAIAGETPLPAALPAVHPDLVAGAVEQVVEGDASQPLPGRKPTRVPLGLYFSTLFLIGGSVAIQTALQLVKRERQAAFRTALTIAVVLGVLFLVVQSVSLWGLMANHAAATGRQSTFGLLFVLVGLHALHFLGGLGVLAVVARQGWRGRFDHEYYHGVKLCAIYWHFLDVVWLLMLVTFIVTANLFVAGPA